MNKRNIEAIYPLSPMQQGMLFHSLQAPESGVYVEQVTCALRGELDTGAFRRAWQRVVSRHPVLRTAFAWKSLDKTFQVVNRSVELPFQFEDWRDLSPETQRARRAAYLQTDRERGFDLSKAPLIRLALMRVGTDTGEDSYEFFWTHHHILLDGWSLPLILKEVFSFYQAFRQAQELHLPEPQPYRTYINWLQQQPPVADYWRQELEGFYEPTPLAIKSSNIIKNRVPHFCAVKQLLSPPVTVQLQQLAKQHRLTLSTIIQGTWGLLLSRYSGEEDIVFGSTVSGRPPELPGVENMVGLFINTLPVRVQVPAETPVVEWLKNLHSQLVELRQYAHTPLVDIQGWSGVPRGTPLFESLFVFENYPVDSALQDWVQELGIEDIRSIEQTNYPLTVVSSSGDRIPLEVHYDAHLFEPESIDRLVQHWQTLLEHIDQNPQQELADLSILSQAEYQQLVVDWPATQTPFPEGQCIHELFEAQAGRTPEADAVVFEDHKLTYVELNRRANQLAHYIQNLGVGPDVIVGICLEPSLEMLTGLLGIFKAGGAYLPLDPTYPPERLAFMIEDAGISVLLTQHSLIFQLPVDDLQVICLDSEWSQIAEMPQTNPLSCVVPENLAYVIYTSGSTGKPKGTLLEHRGLTNMVTAWTKIVELEPGDRVLQYLSFGFDASISTLFPCLLVGAMLYLVPRALILYSDGLCDFMRSNQITHSSLTPSTLDVLSSEDLPALKSVVVGGEICPPELVARWVQGRHFINAYGPTETTVVASYHKMTAVSDALSIVPIGTPLPNVRLYVLDSHMKPVPIGVPGELYIGGVCVARGYLNRSLLTSERFVPDLFINYSGGNSESRLYKTGDKVRYRSDGTLEFLGRIDQQVKVRGFRVELGEIEAVLNQHPIVRQSVILAREGQLVAYIVPTEEVETEVAESVDAQKLQGYLSRKLPSYMVPSFYVVLESLPLTPSGKVNRRALPSPEEVGKRASSQYTAPRTQLEELLAQLWAQVLGVDRVGIHDDFFVLGGHSLLAMRLVSRIRQVLQVEVPLQVLFESSTVAEFSPRIDQLLRIEQELETLPIEPQLRDGELPLSFSQQRLWFLDQLAPGNLFYNIPMAVKLTGPLDIVALEDSLNEVVRRHEALRTTFAEQNGQPVQIIAPEMTIKFVVEDLTHYSDSIECESVARKRLGILIQQPFNLHTGPLIRAYLLKLTEEVYLIGLNVHHIIADGWSLEILIRELSVLYAAFTQGRVSPLPPLPVQYADFAIWQRQWLQGQVLESQLAYWKEQLRDQPMMLELPTDHPRPAMQTWRGATLDFSLPPELSNALQQLSLEMDVTLFMTLLTAFTVLLYRYTGQDDISIGTAIANRNRHEIEKLIGFFVNTLVIRNDLSGNPGFHELLRRVRKVTMDAYMHQDVPFEMLVEELQPERDMSHTPLFQVAFALQNALSEPLSMPGLVVEPLNIDSVTAKFDLMLTMSEGTECLNGVFEYNTDLFEASTIERLVGHFTRLLDAIVEQPQQPIAHLSLLTIAERQTILDTWNATTMPSPLDQCAHELFEIWVERQPSATALIFGDQSLTYRELDQRANQLAHYLRRSGVVAETLVGICTERSLEMIVGILGVLKAGGAYVPLDPTYPQERLAFMIEDSAVPVLLAQEHLTGYLPAHQSQVIRLDADWQSLIALEPETKLHSDVSPENLAYVIYTSGSTGKPKGAMLHHRGLSNLTAVQQEAFNVCPGTRVLQFSPFSFDASVWETFMALANGGTLCLARQTVLSSGSELLQLLREKRINIVTLPPSVLAVLQPDIMPDLHTVISAGEACTAELVQQWSPGRKFFNAYGPTETTVCASMYLCDAFESTAPPIGRPIGNSQLYILDKDNELVPVGVPGELCIGGVNVGRGYLNRPELTRAKYIPNPFDNGSSRLYKTGDLVRYRPDGNIEFLGRIDHQVKVRGFRIELGEIEARLRQHPQVQESVVLARNDTPGGRQLVAYVTPSDGDSLPTGALRGFLRESLPDYMIPAFFVPLEIFPLTPSGKVNRKALPPVDGGKLNTAREYVAPRNDIERQLAEISAELLGVERVGIHDNFFELGGHSLLATQFMSHVRETLHMDIPLRELFEHPSIAELAPRVEELKPRTDPELEKIAAILAQVKELSDEDVQSLLEDKGVT